MAAVSFGSSRRSFGQLLPWLLFSLAIIGADQLTKFAVARSMQLGESIALTSFFNLILAHNKGAAFSFLATASGWQGQVFTAVGLAAPAFMIYLLARHGGQRMFSFALALILGGALGNVIDRLMHGYVIDFLDFHVHGWHWPAFNVADSAIVCGAALLILDELRRVRRSH